MKQKIIIVIILALFFSSIYLLSRQKNSSRPRQIENKQEQVLNQQPPDHPDSIPAMAKKEFTGSDLKIIKTISTNSDYTRYAISYNSEGFTISGIMNVPQGDGPFPVIILNHGYLDPDVYKSGDGLPRELDYFARNGYVVLHSDYRNYGNSDFDPNNEVRPRSGYVEDVINAVVAVKQSSFGFIDKENIGMFGHSMGGGITTNVMVTKPDLAKAYVLYAPINSDYKVNFDRWVAPIWPDVAQEFYDTYGTYEQNPEFWKSISAKNYLDNVSKPVMLHQGTIDVEVPVDWSRDLARMLEEKQKDITYYEYSGEPHVFRSSENLMLTRTKAFFDKNLKQN